jgi:hypothetical protein
MSIEIIMGVDWDIDGEILGWADVGDGWCETDLWDNHTIVGDVLNHCPSVEVESEFYDAGPLSGISYIVSTADPVRARKEIRDRVAAMIRQWRRENQAREESRQTTPPVQRDELASHEVETIAREVCGPAPEKSAIDGFKGWNRIEVGALGQGGREALPEKIETVARMQMSVGIAEYSETIHFRRTRTRDELWVSGEYSGGRAIVAPRCRRKIHAMHRLIAVRILSGAGYAWPESISGYGPVSSESLRGILSTIENFLDEKRQKAQDQGSDAEIVRLARELGLHPEPQPGSEGLWQAGCPSGNHHLDISVESSAWFCGYCGGKGGPDELREFVAGRRKEP